jgi:serine/threonine protein kinase
MSETPKFDKFDIDKYPNCISFRKYFVDYEIIRNTQTQLMNGSNQHIYFGKSFKSGEKVVIKFIKPHYKIAQSLELHKSKIKHSNIADLKDYYLNYVKIPYDYVGEPQFWLISVQEFIEGHDLFTELFSNTKQSKSSYQERELFIKYVSREIISIIKDLEEIGLIHSDIKCENIIYTPETKKITLIDTDYLAEVGNIRICGTYEYFSWETVQNGLNRARKEDEDKQYKLSGTSDLWAVGVLIYIGIIHRFPFNVNPSSSLKPNFKNIINLNYYLPDYLSKELIDFLSKIFVRPSERISLQEALNHPWFNLDISNTNILSKN